MRFAVLGTGYWADHTHATAIAAHPDAELVGVWGRNPAKAENFAGRFGVRAFEDLDDILAEVEAVTIAVPPPVQADLAVRAAQAGRHLLLDKPLALSVEAADRVVDAVTAAGVQAIVFFTQRYHSNVDTFLARAAGQQWDSARVSMYSSIFGPDSPYAGSLWRREKGGLWDIGPHALSLVVPVLGPVVEGRAMSGPHATTHAMLRHSSGAVSHLGLSLEAPSRLFESVLYGAQGQVAIPAGDGTSVTAFGRAIDQLTDLVTGRRTEHPCDVRFAREVVAVLSALDRDRG